MKFFICLCLLVLVSFSSGADLQVGSSVNSTIAYIEEVKLSARPFTIRTKNVFFTDEQKPNQKIKGISAIDILNSTASAKITAGGVDSTFVNIRLKSSRGDGLHYQIQIFV
nr:silk gland uncharacterized 8 [Tineola bisselliella]